MVGRGARSLAHVLGASVSAILAFIQRDVHSIATGAGGLACKEKKRRLKR
jgi:hypothetical protein